jgi:hypothetical protein
MSNPNNSPSDELLDILHRINNEDPRKKYVVTSLPDDIQKMFDKELEKPPYEAPHRREPWQFWYNNTLSGLTVDEMKDYTDTLYALQYDPKIDYDDIKYNINSDETTEKEVLKRNKETFNDKMKEISNQTRIPFQELELHEEEKPVLQQLFESEKANIASIIMQSDQKLNEFLLDFLVKLIIIVREGLAACKYLDKKCKLKGDNSDYDIVELLNRSMPLARRQHNMDKKDEKDESYVHVTPGSFTVTRETLTIEGIKSLNFREKVQLMNCFWNCTSHKLEGIEKSDRSNIYEKTRKRIINCKDSHLKIRTKHKTAPVLNMIYEKVAKNKHLLLDVLDGRNLKNLRSFIEKITNFKSHTESGLQNRKFPLDHSIPSGRYPLCYDYNETKKRWKPVVDNVDEGESNLFPVVITDDFLINIEKIFQDYVNTSTVQKQELTSIKMSDNEKIYMKEYETNKITEIDNGYIYWTTGFSLSKLNLDGILSYNMIRQAEIANNTFTSEETKEKEERVVNKNYKYIKGGLSGSTWKYLQLAYFMGSSIDENKVYLDRMYHVAIAFLVGCYHHSWYEVTRAALDFRRELEKNENTIYPDTLGKYKLTIDDSFWILNSSSKLWEDSNTSLHPSTRKYLKRFFLSEKAQGGEGRNPKSHNNYLHFYRKFLHPLIPLKSDVGSIKKLLEKMQSEVPNNVHGRERRAPDRLNLGGKGKKTRKIQSGRLTISSTRKRQSGRLTRRTPTYSGGKKTRKRKSKFPYISRGGGLI